LGPMVAPVAKVFSVGYRQVIDVADVEGWPSGLRQRS
jgi:hypothetical protein